MFSFFRAFALCLLLSFAPESHAQDKKIDSLLTALENPKLHDTTRLRTIALFRDQFYSSADKNYYYLSRVLGDLAYKNYKNKAVNKPEVQQKYTMWLGSYYSLLGSEYFRKPDPENGLAYFDKSISLHKESGGLKNMHFAMISKAALLTKLKRYDEAIPYLFKALKYFESHKKEVYAEDFAYAYYSLGNAYLKQERFDKAIVYYEKTLACYREYDSNNYVNYQMGRTHNRMGEAYFGLKDYDAAVSHSEQSLKLIKGMNDPAAEIENLCRIGMVYLEQSELGKAEAIFKQAMALQPNDDTILADEAFFHANLAMSRFYLKKADIAKAAFYGEKALSIAESTNDGSRLTDAAKQLYDVSVAGKNYKRALETNQLLQKLGDASKIEASKNAMAQQQLQYDYEKKALRLKLDAEKKTAAQKNGLIALSGLLLLLLLGGYFYYRNNKQRQAIAALEKNQIKQKLLITQMNPHFIFNSVQNIRNLIERHKNDDAVKYLEEFSVLTRQILENSNESYISLDEELAMIKNYLSIQQMLYDHKFDYTIDVAGDMDADSIFLPPMLTQPFIENAIKHGLAGTGANGRIDIRFFMDGDALIFEITDNGKGFGNGGPASGHKSMAMSITRERLAGYARKVDFTMHTENIKDHDGSSIGAKVRFEIPYIYEN